MLSTLECPVQMTPFPVGFYGHTNRCNFSLLRLLQPSAPPSWQSAYCFVLVLCWQYLSCSTQQPAGKGKESLALLITELGCSGQALRAKSKTKPDMAPWIGFRSEMGMHWVINTWKVDRIKWRRGSRRSEVSKRCNWGERVVLLGSESAYVLSSQGRLQ